MNDHEKKAHVHLKFEYQSREKVSQIFYKIRTRRALVEAVIFGYILARNIFYPPNLPLRYKSLNSFLSPLQDWQSRIGYQGSRK